MAETPNHERGSDPARRLFTILRRACRLPRRKTRSPRPPRCSADPTRTRAAHRDDLVCTTADSAHDLHKHRHSRDLVERCRSALHRTLTVVQHYLLVRPPLLTTNKFLHVSLHVGGFQSIFASDIHLCERLRLVKNKACAVRCDVRCTGAELRLWSSNLAQKWLCAEPQPPLRSAVRRSTPLWPLAPVAFKLCQLASQSNRAHLNTHKGL